MEGVNLRYIVIIYVNIRMYPPEQLIYANKIIKKWPVLQSYGNM
jgi:hypothetical protein